MEHSYFYSRTKIDEAFPAPRWSHPSTLLLDTTRKSRQIKRRYFAIDDLIYAYIYSRDHDKMPSQYDHSQSEAVVVKSKSNHSIERELHFDKKVPVSSTP